MGPIRELSPELLERAKKELNEDPKRRDSDIAAIKEWCKKQPHFLTQPDDQTVLAFLRGCKFSLERTKEKIDMYYTVRTALPEFFKNRDLRSKELQFILNMGTFFPLPKTDELGRRILIGRFSQNDPSTYNINDMFKLNCMMMDYMIREDDESIVCGSVSVMDMSGMSLAHAMQMTPSLMKKSMVVFQDAFPFRPKALNYVHTPSVFETIFNVFRTFAKEKIKKRMFVHGENMETLYKNLPKNLLPSEYGGEAGSMAELNEKWLKMLEKYADWFVSPEGSLGVDESKRPGGKPKTQQDLFGLEGSFRQLNVD